MNIKEYFEKNNITLAEFSKVSGMEKSMICNILSGRQKVGRVVAQRINKLTNGLVTVAECLLTEQEVHELLESKKEKIYERIES